MKIVLLERNSAGTDVPVDCFNELGEVTSYPNTVTAQEVAERVGDAGCHCLQQGSHERGIPEGLPQCEADL